jgi:alpha-L-fucosidase 2
MSAGNWARLGEGGNVEMVLQHLVKRSVNPSLFSTFNQGRKSLQNDGNLGITAAIGETLLQSRPTYSGDDLAAGKNVTASGEVPVELHLLPALLPSWPTGRVAGLCARGGFTVDLQWTPQTVEATIRSTWGTRCRVRLGNRVEDLEIPRGGVKVLKWGR